MTDDISEIFRIQVESGHVTNDILIMLRSQESGLGHTNPTDTGSL